MKNIIALGGLTSILFLSGCVSDPTFAWRKSNTTLQDTGSAQAKCRYDVGIAKVAPADKPQMIADCMQAQGFRWVAVD
jgi:GTP cyclohydrolase III